ncbi:unnamed protein product [Cladocopium goreaui]|uniref:Uncharacterized protein n=1 Tax=Cladocopium goreaui TaxID=2562237 RepID=A0A9P1GCM7_9DINO|nr:unnamed protein product [Cladocopium goreaui]
MEMVGKGRGDFEKEQVVVATGYKLNIAVCGGCAFLVALGIFLLLGFGNSWWQPAYDMPVGMSPMTECSLLTARATLAEKNLCCDQGFKEFCHKEVIREVDQYMYNVKNVKVDRMVPVPIAPPPRQVITHKVLVHTDAFDCDEGLYNMQHTWSAEHSRYCCYKREIGCKTKVVYRPHYHTITRTRAVPVHVPVPIPAPPAQVITHVENVPIHDPPAVIKVPERGPTHVVNRYVHEKHYVPAPVASPPQYHHVPVPVPVLDPGQVIKVPSPLPAQTIVKNKVLYKTRHIAVKHVYDCSAGFSNWMSGWSSDKKSWCCAHETRGCPGDQSGHLTKTVVTGVTEHEGPTYYHHAHVYDGSYEDGTVIHHGGSWAADAVDGGVISGDAGVISGSSGSFSHVSSSWLHDRDLKDGKEKKKDSRRLQMVGGDVTYGGSYDGGEAHMVGGDVTYGGSYDGGEAHMVGGDVTYGGSYDGGEAHMVGGDVTYGGSYDGGEAHMVGRDVTYGGSYGDQDHVAHHVIHRIVPVPSAHPKEDVHTIVRRHYGTVYRKIPVNHYVKVQMPQKPPIIHTVHIQEPAKHYDCGMSGTPQTFWTEKHKRWCCYKFRGDYCPKTVIDKNIYHTVVKTQPVRVPVPEPMPTHSPIVKTIHHTYHVPSPPQYVHVHVPGPTVVKHVAVPETVPVPVPEPPKVIDVKEPYAVHVRGPDHYVHVPVPSPPHVVTKYHTQWNTVVDHASDTYDCASDAATWHSVWSHAKQIWCCSHRQIGCPGSWSGATHVTSYHSYHGHTGNWLTDHLV